jgi:hypothetical protein
MRHLILIILLIVSLWFIFLSLTRINQLYDSNKIGKSKRVLLTYISIILPIVGYLWVRQYKLVEIK